MPALDEVKNARQNRVWLYTMLFITRRKIKTMTYVIRLILTIVTCTLIRRNAMWVVGILYDCLVCGNNYTDTGHLYLNLRKIKIKAYK